MRHRNVGLDEWRLRIAEQVAEGKTILEAAGRNWDGSVEHRLPKDPSTIGREHRGEQSDEATVVDADGGRPAPREAQP